jgi:transposase
MDTAGRTKLLHNLAASGMSRTRLATIFDVSERTIRRWMKPVHRVYKRRGRPYKCNPDLLFQIPEWKESGMTITQSVMAKRLYSLFSVKVGCSTIGRMLKRNGITRKKATFRNTEQLGRCHDIIAFKERVSRHKVNLLALDECSFLLNEAVRFGYSRKGTRMVVQRPAIRGQRYSFLLCIANDHERAIIHSAMVAGSFNAVTFQRFLSEMPSRSGDFLMLDNARIHHATKGCRKEGLPTIAETARQKGIHLEFLPPYTPELNPVELCFNVIREKVSRVGPRSEVELRDIILNALSGIDGHCIERMFNHALKFQSLNL